MTTPQKTNWLAHEHRARIESALGPDSIFRFRRRRILKTLRLDTLPTLVAHGYMGNADAIPEQIIIECRQNDSFSYLNDLATYLTDTKDSPAKSQNGIPLEKYDLITYFKGLKSGTLNKHGHRLRFNHYSQVSPEERAVQRAIITAATTIDQKHVEQQFHKYEIGITRLASDALIRYLMAHPDRTDEVVTLINAGRVQPTETSLNNVEDFLTLRSDVSTPLRDGAL